MKTAEVGGGGCMCVGSEQGAKTENLAAVLSYLNCSSLLKTAIALFCSFFLGSLAPFLPKAQPEKAALSKDRSALYFVRTVGVFEPRLQPPKTTIQLLFPQVAAFKMAPILIRGRRPGGQPLMSTFSLATLHIHWRAIHKF